MSTNFSPTPAELTLVSQIFAQADPQKIGVLTGDVAVRVFGGAKLPPTTLGEIWNISDEDNKGWLPKKGVAIAVRLIGWAQKGEKMTQALVNKPGPLAVIEGYSTVSQHNTGMSLPKSPPPSSFPPLTTQDKAKFQNMFMKSGPVHGLLAGEKARDIFVKSKLPNEQLMKIWTLADTQDRGTLDSTDFAVGMYFIQGVMTGKISSIPNTLPPGLYQQAGGGSSNTGSVRSHITGDSGSFSPIGSTFTPYAGRTQLLQPDHTGISSKSKPPHLPPRTVNGHAQEWDVTPTEKASADRFFDTLDIQKRGYIEGEVAVPFMLESKLPGEILAQIWDLADINNDGCLTREGFAIALHLIQKKLAGQEIPHVLPPSLLPPSARGTPAIGPSPFSPASAPSYQQPEPHVDLFSFDDTPPQSASIAAPLNHFGSLQAQTTGSISGAIQPVYGKRSLDNDPFSSTPFRPSPHQDLLSDDDAHPTSPPLHDQSAEIGNTKNQLQSTNRALASAQEERAALEQTLANQASQLSTLQTQLSSARAAYETETSLLSTFKERRNTQVAEIQKTKEELIRAESDLSAVRVEKAEIEGAFLRDKEEARELHKRMMETGQQVDALKVDVEKLKKEAKQQKGLLAIARKQLSTKESEKAKVEKEHADAVEDVNSVTQEKNAAELELANFTPSVTPKAPERALSSSDTVSFAAAQPLPITPDFVSSPSASVKSNNPFERLAMSSGNSTPRSTSPFLPLQGNTVPNTSQSLNETTSPPKPTVLNTASDSVTPASAFDAIDFTSEDQDTEISYLGEETSSVHAHDTVLSPATANGTDYFLTPPSSATNEASPSSPTNPKERFPSLDDIPESSAHTSASPAGPSKAKADVGTDLNTHLKDLDIEESDSDDSEDETPLAQLSAIHNKGPSSSQSRVIETNTSTAAAAPVADFDDIFGSDADGPAAAKVVQPSNGNPTPFDLSTPATDQSKIANGKTATQELAVAGVNEFDEAMNKIPGSATPANFSFDSAFDDDFDFAKASKVDFSPTQPNETQGDRFADIFGANNEAPAGPSHEPSASHFPPPPTHNVPKPESVFDEVFAGFESGPVTKLEDNPNAFTHTPKFDEPSMPGSFHSSPTPVSPKPAASSPRAPEVRPVSPAVRERSPPPRMLSPKPRLSSSSSKEIQDKAKDPPPRHSKLSQIRLPFGKKKKQPQPEAMPPPVSHHLTPPIEEPHRTSTPAAQDDVESVKQLTAMGFSRSQAVDALEKYGYDVQKALNSLLGAQ